MLLHFPFRVSGFCAIQNGLALALPIWERDLTLASARHGAIINTTQHNNTSTILCAIAGRRAITHPPTTWLYSNCGITLNRPMACGIALGEIAFSAVGVLLDRGKTNSLRGSVGLPCHHSAHCRYCPSECLHIGNRRATLGVFIPEAACPSFFFVVFTIRDKRDVIYLRVQLDFTTLHQLPFYNRRFYDSLPATLFSFLGGWLQVKFPAQIALHARKDGQFGIVSSPRPLRR
jgi:hypothetical protein